MSQQCQGVKRDGTRCQRQTRTPYCYLHSKQTAGPNPEPNSEPKTPLEPEVKVVVPSPIEPDEIPPKVVPSEDECSICLTPGPYQSLPCGHNYFCSSCLAAWTRQTCPFCWTSYETKPKVVTSVPNRRKVPVKQRRGSSVSARRPQRELLKPR